MVEGRDLGVDRNVVTLAEFDGRVMFGRRRPLEIGASTPGDETNVRQCKYSSRQVKKLGRIHVYPDLEGLVERAFARTLARSSHAGENSPGEVLKKPGREVHSFSDALSAPSMPNRVKDKEQDTELSRALARTPIAVLTGTVINPTGLKPIGGADVGLENPWGGGGSVRSKEDGSFKVRVRPGTYDFSVRDGSETGVKIIALRLQNGEQSLGAVQTMPQSEFERMPLYDRLFLMKRPCFADWTHPLTRWGRFVRIMRLIRMLFLFLPTLLVCRIWRRIEFRKYR